MWVVLAGRYCSGGAPRGAAVLLGTAAAAGAVEVTAVPALDTADLAQAALAAAGSS